MAQINGVICDTLTFSDKNNEIVKSLNSLLIRHILTNDADCLLLFGSMGDGKVFTNNIGEKIELIDLALNISENKTPLLIGVDGPNADSVIEQISILGKRFKNLNYLICPLFAKKLSDNSIKSYFETILGAIESNDKIYLNNNPLKTAGNEIEPDILKSLTEFDNLRGINDTFYNIKKCKSYLHQMDENFSVFCGLEDNFQNFFPLIPIENRRNSGIVSSLSNLVNICSKLYNYALEDNILSLLQTQEQINDIRDKIYDIKDSEEGEKVGLKYAITYLYKELLSKTDEKVNYIVSTLQSVTDTISKDRIEATVNYLLNNKLIYKLYSIGKKDLYQFHEIINTFSKINILVKQGNVRKIKGPYVADINTIYRVKFDTSQLVFRFRTSKFYQFENLIKQKLLFPFLDQDITPQDRDLRLKIKEIISKKTGAHLFKKEKPPIIPVSNLVYYDETKETIPFVFSVQEYIHGKPLFQLLEKYRIQGISTNTNRFQTLFDTLGHTLANLHQIKFESYFKNIREIGKSKRVSYFEAFNNELENILDKTNRNKAMPINEVKDFFKENATLIEDEDEFVSLHNDFQGRNILVKEDQGIIRVNGLVDFDDWCVGSRAQDFIKFEFLILQPLANPSVNSAFYNAYSESFPINNNFRKKIEIYKLLWLLKMYNFESDLVRKSPQVQTANGELTSLEKYLLEINEII
ncbi:MAG: dihydrodipicolinate synthase family protein [Promethearchaeota archaeon]